MISLKRAKSTIVNSTIMEYLMDWIGMGAGTETRKLYQQGGEYIVTEMIQKASSSDQGYTTVEVPFSRIFSHLPTWLGGNQIREIAVVTDPKLAREIGNYGTGRLESFDPDARLPFRLIDLIMKSIVSRNDPQVKEDRKLMKQVMHDFDWNLKITRTEFGKWLKVANDQPINLEKSIKITMIKILGQSLLGFHVFPPDYEVEENSLSLNGLSRILDRMDEAIILFDTEAISRYETELWEYSEWFYQHNRESIEDIGNQHNIFPFLVKNKDNLKKVNLAAAFLVTPNITKLIYLTVIFFSTNPNWQKYLRQVLNSNDDQALKRLYNEFCRLFIPTAIPRYTSKEMVFSGVKFKADTMFYISGRAIRMNPEIFPEPEKFWPDRFLENNIRMNSHLLSPFGIGVRQCPAASQFTEKIWRTVIETVFSTHQIEMVNQIRMEEFPVDVQIIKLQNQYFARIKREF